MWRQNLYNFFKDPKHGPFLPLPRPTLIIYEWYTNLTIFNFLRFKFWIWVLITFTFSFLSLQCTGKKVRPSHKWCSKTSHSKFFLHHFLVVNIYYKEITWLKAPVRKLHSLFFFIWFYLESVLCVLIQALLYFLSLT